MKFYKLSAIVVSIYFLLLFCYPNSVFADVHVKGYTRKDGTYVAPHYRSDPDSSKLNNWSTKGNVNPHTGKEGTLDPYDDSSSTYTQPTKVYSPPTYQPTQESYISEQDNIENLSDGEVLGNDVSNEDTFETPTTTPTMSPITESYISPTVSPIPSQTLNLTQTTDEDNTNSSTNSVITILAIGAWSLYAIGKKIVSKN